MRISFRWFLGCALCLTTGLELLAQSTNWAEIQQHYQKGQAALQSQQNALAEAEFRAILLLDPKSASAHANLGIVAFREGNYPQAAQEFRSSLKLRPDLWNAKAFLGMSELREGHPSQAEPLLAESFEHLQDDQLKSEVGMDLITVYQPGRLDRSVDILRVLMRIRPAGPAVLYAAYRTYSDMAAKSLADLVQAAPDSPEMHQVLAQAAASQDDFPGAIAQYHKILEINPQLPEVHYELGQMILVKSQGEAALAEAEKEFNLCLAEDPTHSYSEYMLGEIAWLRSKPDEALRHDRRALDLQPGFVDAHIAAGKALTILGRPIEALGQLQEAVRLDPRNEVAHYRLAQAYRKMGQIPDAEREDESFRKLRDSHAPVRALYQQLQERTVVHQSILPNEPQ